MKPQQSLQVEREAADQRWGGREEAPPCCFHMERGPQTTGQQPQGTGKFEGIASLPENYSPEGLWLCQHFDLNLVKLGSVMALQNCKIINLLFKPGARGKQDS